MENTNKRNTKQKATIINFLKENKNKHLTAEQIYRKLTNYNVSQATVYRILNTLSSCGIVRKFYIDEKMPACYQYIEEDCNANKHYHFICNSCEKVFHFEDKKIEDLKKSLATSQDFFIDTDKTVFYGICKNCLKGGKNE